MLNCNNNDQGAARKLHTSLGSQLGKLTPPGELSLHYRLPPSHVSPLLRPPVDIPGTITKLIQPPCDWTKQSSPVEIGAAVGKSVAHEVCRIVKNHTDIEVVHVFTHGGDQPSIECDAGLFNNRGKYYSPLRKTQSIDNYNNTHPAFIKATKNKRN